jgi:hypothetical protein
MRSVESRSGRYRANKRRQGMRQLRIRVPDPHAPGFEAEAGRQALLLRQAPDETQALDFVAKVMDWDHLNQ